MSVDTRVMMSSSEVVMGCCVLFLVGGCWQGTLKKLKKEWDAQKKLHDKFLDKSAAGGATAAPLAANGAGDSN